MSPKFPAISLGAGVRPSSLLFVPGSSYIYVGGSDGLLYQIDVSAAPSVEFVPLGDARATVGAPSLDRDNSLVHVGTEAGVFYRSRGRGGGPLVTLAASREKVGPEVRTWLASEEATASSRVARYGARGSSSGCWPSGAWHPGRCSPRSGTSSMPTA